MKSQNNNETIGDKIKQLRNKQGLTQDELARKSDLPYTTLTKIETNVITKPSIQTVMKIAKGLGVSLDDFMKFNSHIFGRRFGGWLNALEKAGLQKTRNYNVSDEEAFQNLENIWMKLGKQPRREDLCAPLSKYSGAFYEYRFGT